MKVKDLIRYLQSLPEEADVYIYRDLVEGYDYTGYEEVPLVPDDIEYYSNIMRLTLA